MTLSGLCLLHCLASTLVLTAFAAGGAWMNHDVHAIGLLIALPLGAVALWRGVATHGRVGVAVLGMAGLAMMAASLLVGHGSSAETVFSMVGVAVLGMAHWWNLRATRA